MNKTQQQLIDELEKMIRQRDYYENIIEETQKVRRSAFLYNGFQESLRTASFWERLRVLFFGFNIQKEYEDDHTTGNRP